MSAARIGRQNWRVLRAPVVSTLSMWSMAGITVARFSVPSQEKKSVASLKIDECIGKRIDEINEKVHLQSLTQLTC